MSHGYPFLLSEALLATIARSAHRCKFIALYVHCVAH
jgi:hypothetical protein